MTDIILECDMPAGDTTLLTAAVRDLHITYPLRFRTAIRSSFPELWENNPHVTSLKEIRNDAPRICCNYDLTKEVNLAPFHSLQAFVDCLNEALHVKISPSAFKGDIYLADYERDYSRLIESETSNTTPIWIIATGGKRDAMTKWWPIERYQAVIDHFAGLVRFVQVGLNRDVHPKLQRVTDLRGKTNLRELIRLIYHAQGVLCPVTSLMHLAAAIENKGDYVLPRACIVIAGGREPPNWEAYPHHQFIHTNGSLLCCDQGGCWKSRVYPIGDGSEFDLPSNLCVNPCGSIPRCLDMISVDHVVRRIELSRTGAVLFRD
jgi:ADP-heptose:LPS heptosyltransferase